MLDLQIRESRGLDEINQVRQLRYAVLREPLGMPYEETLFSGDDHPDTRHLVAYRDIQPVGCLTLMPPEFSQGSHWVQLRGMAVLAEFQSMGVGSQLLRLVAAKAKEHRWNLWCKARQLAIPFYANNGWLVVGDVFDIPMIGPHYRMEWKL